MARVSLSKKQLTTEAGQSLLSLLAEVTQDGSLSDAEVHKLRDWLEANRECADVPAIAWLRELLQAVLADGKVTPDERWDLLLAFDKVFPPEERVLAKLRRKNAPREATAWTDQHATSKQVAYLQVLGVKFDASRITKAEASDLIDKAKDRLENAPSNRQMMVLRFWDQVALAEEGKGSVSEWMDFWYRKDDRHRDAWDLWKVENGLASGQGDPNLVPIGEGFRVLPRLKVRPAEQALPKQGKKKQETLGPVGTFVMWSVLIAALWYFLKR